jgi:23S rRNA (cytosine1962-C5)-methyltransferase
MVRPPMNRPVSRKRSPPKTEVRRPGLVVRQGQYRVADDVARRIRTGHPWVYRDALATRAVSEPTGGLVELIAGNREFVARGYVDQEHPVAVRILSRDPGEKVHPGAGAIAARVTRAIQLRWLVMGGERPTALRLFSGESEGLPGATIDRYGEFVVIQWLSGGALVFRDEVLDAVAAAVRPRGIYEQRRLRPLGGQAPPEPGTLARGDQAPVEVIVEEEGCRFAVDVSAPMGVGFFPDLRLGRDAVARRASGRRVLNLFSYTGAFSVRAARAGASGRASTRPPWIRSPAMPSRPSSALPNAASDSTWWCATRRPSHMAPSRARPSRSALTWRPWPAPA